MNFEKAVDSIPLINDLKRIASAYVIDYRNLDELEIRDALKKTAPQYFHDDNVKKSINYLYFQSDRDSRVLAPIFLKEVLLNKDGHMCPQKETEDEIISFQQEIIDRSNEDITRRNDDRRKKIELFRFVLETAWDHNDEISIDERNLIEKIRIRLKISDNEYRLVEAKIGKFPKSDNVLHTRREIENVRRILQSQGLLFSFRDNEGRTFDVIPCEVAQSLRKALNLEIRRHGYKEMLKVKYVRNKSYLTQVLEKGEVTVEGNPSLEALQEMCIELIRPSNVLGGFSIRDGLDRTNLAQWCTDLSLNVSGTKVELVQRLLDFYDNLLEREDDPSDERMIWYDYFEALARRDIGYLRSQQIITRDLEIEQKFEQATQYLFEKKLRHKPLTLAGSMHADGALSYRDMLIYWDNKSKESSVNLRDHIRQFDGYIRNAEKKVACFLVIGPEFTDDSGLLAMQFQVEQGTTITLMRASDLKGLADDWSNRETDDPFPLGYLIQPGLFNRSLVAL